MADAGHSQPSALSGVSLMVLASASFSVMFAFVKALGPDFPHFEGIFFRAVLSLPVTIWLLRRQGCGLRPRRPGLMAVRGLVGFVGMTSYFYAVQHGRLADMAAISRTQPILVSCLAPLLIGDRAPALAWVTLVLGFGGALLVIKPGFGLFNLAGLVALMAALFSALAHLTVRRLNATEPPQRIVFYFTVIVAVVGGLISIPSFVLPDLRQLLLLLGLAHGATAGQLLMTMAYSRERAPVVAAAGYTVVVFSLGIGLVIWREVPDLVAMAGMAVIIGAGVLLAYSRRGAHEPPATSH